MVAWYVLSHTPFGRSLYAIGSNAASARLVGLRVDRHVLLSFVIAGTIAGAAGVLQLSRTGSATADSGTSVLFPALAAVFLGATAVRPGFFNVPGTLVGALFVSFAVSGLTISGPPRGPRRSSTAPPCSPPWRSPPGSAAAAAPAPDARPGRRPCSPGRRTGRRSGGPLVTPCGRPGHTPQDHRSHADRSHEGAPP